MKNIWADIRISAFAGSWTVASGNKNQEHKHLRENNNINNIKYKNVKPNKNFLFNNWICFSLGDWLLIRVTYPQLIPETVQQ